LKISENGLDRIKTAPAPAKAEDGLIAIHVEKPKVAERSVSHAAAKRVKKENILAADQLPAPAASAATGAKNLKKEKSNESKTICKNA